MKAEIVKTGVVAELNGQYWGVTYASGRQEELSEYGFGPIERAVIGDPDYCKQPTDMTCEGSLDEALLRKARLLPVRVTTAFEVTPDFSPWNPHANASAQSRLPLRRPLAASRNQGRARRGAAIRG